MDDRLKLWEPLFQRALRLIDNSTQPFGPWSFGGGTVLMRRYQHRASKDIDIFVSDQQSLGGVTPRLNDFAAQLTGDYVEGHLFLKLTFPEGEIDFIASAPLTEQPTKTEQIFGRAIEVETSAEIIAKKVWHRAEHFKARDVLDLALVAEREPAALHEIAPVLRERKDAILARLAASETQLRDDFAQLEILNYRRTYDECVDRARRALEKAG